MSRYCTRCPEPASRRLGKSWLCPMHYRLCSMRYTAKREGKPVPTVGELEWLVRSLDGMRCPHCKGVMTWQRGKAPGSVVTLQHDRDGSMRLLCLACNGAHANYPEDTFYDMPLASSGEKRCGKCWEIKPLSCFRLRADGRRHTSYCVECQAKLPRRVK